MAGISRSVTLVVAYLMESRAMKWKDAYQLVKRKRPIVNLMLNQICPNDAFLKQLSEY